MGLKDFERQKIRFDQNLDVSTRTWSFNWLYHRAIKHCRKFPNVFSQDIPEGKYIFSFYARILEKKHHSWSKVYLYIMLEFWKKKHQHVWNQSQQNSGHGSVSPPKKLWEAASNLARSDSRKLLAAARSHAGHAPAAAGAAALSRSRQMRPFLGPSFHWMNGGNPQITIQWEISRILKWRYCAIFWAIFWWYSLT